MKKVKKHIHIGQEEIEADADILEPMWCEVDIYDGYEKYERDLARFTLEQRYVLATEQLKFEVENGGYCPQSIRKAGRQTLI